MDDGKSCIEVAQVLYLDDDTVRGWYKQYLLAGWEFVAYDGWKGGQSRLSRNQEAALCVWLESRFCRSVGEVRAWIIQEFAVQYSHSGCVKLLARLGFEYRKPKALPPVADEAAQASFIDFYQSLMNCLAADEAVYFSDATHPDYQARPAYGWVGKGQCPAVKITDQPGRVNIQAAVNLESFDVPFVEPLTVDGKSTVQQLAKIEARNPDKRLIHVIWDNAGYHRGPDVRAFLSRPDCRIRLTRLPPRCPHLNPIERLWAVMHRHVTHNRFYTKYTAFAAAILRFFRETILKHWRNFRDHVSDNFRVIDNQSVRVME